MLRIRPEHAHAGMELALPIYHPSRPDAVILKPGVKLEQSTVDRVREMGLPEIWARHPKLDGLQMFVSSALHQRRAQAAQAAQALFDRVARSMEKPDFSQAQAAGDNLAECIAGLGRAALHVQEFVFPSNPLAARASNIAFVSLLMASRLDAYLIRERPKLDSQHARDVGPLGLAALVHDIGVPRLAPEVIERWERHRDETDPEWRRHVLLGYEIVQSNIPPAASATVLNHHQRFDGSGYPARRAGSGELVAVTGRNIHIFARIVGCAELFERLRDDGEQRRSVIETLDLMRNDVHRHGIDQTIFRALLAVVPPYPPGTIVTISSGQDCVVTDF
ncbi:MAG: HD domain-containing phosphohydrolase, partial [Planctomycetota bacterium]